MAEMAFGAVAAIVVIALVFILVVAYGLPVEED